MLRLRKQSDKHQFGLASRDLIVVTTTHTNINHVFACLWVCQRAMHFSFIRRNNVIIVFFLVFRLFVFMLSNFPPKFQTVIRLTTDRIFLSTICDKWSLHFWNSQSMCCLLRTDRDICSLAVDYCVTEKSDLILEHIFITNKRILVTVILAHLDMYVGVYSGGSSTDSLI